MADAPSNEAEFRRISDCRFGAGVVVHSFCNLYGCEIGTGTRIGTFVEIQRGARVGERCKVQSHTFICEGVTIADECFIGHSVTFVNDKYPKATGPGGELASPDEWELAETVVERGASIGSGAVILGGVRIGAEAIVGAGAVVTEDVATGERVAGNPARRI